MYSKYLFLLSPYETTFLFTIYDFLFCSKYIVIFRKHKKNVCYINFSLNGNFKNCITKMKIKLLFYFT